MLVNAIDILNKARENKYAIPQFNINNLEWTKYILEECEELKSPVILGASEGAINHMGGYKTVNNIVTGLIADLNITIPVVLHLDHGKTVEQCKEAVNNGFSSVMIDGSKKKLAENIKMTKEVVVFCRKKLVSVEAEVGQIGGTEDNITGDAIYASLKDCKKLVIETDVDLLAPALGSVHGLYKGEPNLDFDRMQEINRALKIPLVLHGGTGIPNDKIKKAITCGISKININTDLQIVWADALKEYIRKNPDVYDPRKIIGAGEKVIKQKIREKIILFCSNNKAYK